MRVAKNSVQSIVTKRIVTVIAVSALAFGLSACGGGGGGTTDLVVNKPGVALFTTAPSTLTLDVDASAVYKIGGGGGGTSFTTYSATSSNSDVLTAVVDGTNVTFKAIKPGSATVAIKDSAGASVSLTVTVGNSTTLAIQAPTLVNTQIGATTTYKIAGGTGPFIATSSNLGVVTPFINQADKTLTLTGMTVGGAQIIVFDSKGSSSTITTSVTSGAVAASLYTTAPAFISLSVDGVVPTYQIGGGTPPYVVTSASPDILIVTPSTSGFTVKGKAVGFGSLAIKDATGASSTINVSIVSGKVQIPFYTTAPGSVTLRANMVSTYTIAGGTEPYSVASSDQGVASASLSGTTITLTGLSTGSANVVVRDSVGAVTSIAVTVPNPNTSPANVALYTSAPSAVTVSRGTTSTFTIAGGTSPYTASSGNNTFYTTGVSGSSLSVTGIAVGTSNAVVKDATGAAVTIAVTVQ